MPIDIMIQTNHNYKQSWDNFGYLGEDGFIRHTNISLLKIHQWIFENELPVNPYNWNESDQTLFTLTWE